MLNHELVQSAANRSETAAQPLSPSPDGRRTEFRRRVRWLAVWGVIAVIAFGRSLYDLARYSWHSELYSYIVLIPAISLYLIWLKRGNLALDSQPARRVALLPLIACLAILAGYWASVHSGWKPGIADHLALTTLSFLAFLLSGAFLFLGTETLRAVAFPAAFLIFMVPFPEFLQGWIEYFFQQASTEAAYVLFKLSGMPVFRQGTQFQLPGFSMGVGLECSGIHSSVVLFITSLLAGYLFLASPGKRAILTLAVIPLAILRNGLRILTIGELCVHVSPDMINSYIHKRGGPVFFVLSLVPFGVLLFLLRKSEAQKRSRANDKQTSQ